MFIYYYIYTVVLRRMKFELFYVVARVVHF